MENKRPLILVTNDDGMFAPGIRHLINCAKEFGEVVVVAPDSPQSGKGHAITLDQPLRLNKVDIMPEVVAYECNGTPVDCVKLAKHVILKDREPDLCVSGINHGSNASINIIYSGTLSAAMEASLEGIKSVGFSLLNFSFESNFDFCLPYVKEIIQYALENDFGTSKLLNVNIPYVPEEGLSGIKVCRQSKARWVEEFAEGIDPRGRKYYWLKGVFKLEDEGTDHDLNALTSNYISVVPAMHDLTDYEALDSLQPLEKINADEK